MSDLSTIDRAEIAELITISLSKLLNIINNSNAKMPAPMRREGPKLIYDRAVILAWIESNPLENLTWKKHPKKSSMAAQTTELCRDFLSGELGSSKQQRQHKAFRLLAARHAPRPTQRVEVRGGAYDGLGERRGPKPKQQAVR
jgi:hypothetical protein